MIDQVVIELLSSGQKLYTPRPTMGSQMIVHSPMMPDHQMHIGTYMGLQERLDASGHNGMPLHMNYEIQGCPGSQRWLGQDVHLRKL